MCKLQNRKTLKKIRSENQTKIQKIKLMKREEIKDRNKKIETDCRMQKWGCNQEKIEICPKKHSGVIILFMFLCKGNNNVVV